MKITMINRDHKLWEGGDRRKIEYTILALKKIGVDVYYTHNVNCEYNADLVHLFHISYDTAYKALLNVKRQNLPLVVSPVYSGDHIPHKYQQEIIDYSKKIFFLSEGELQFVRNNLVVPNNKVVFIENGVSPIFDIELTKGNYVLCVGRIQPLKNQLNLAVACKKLKLNLKYVGDIIDQEYAKKVLKVWGEWLPNSPQKELVKLYKKARVVACVSEHEVQPNSVLEGGLSGANIVLTEKSKTFTSGYPNIWVCKTDFESIAEAVYKAWNTPKNENLKKIFRTWTWEKTAKKLLNEYMSILEKETIIKK